MSTPGKRRNGKTDSLTDTYPERRMDQGSSSLRVLPSMTCVARRGRGHARGLGDERRGTGGAGVHFEDEHNPVLDRELDIHQADDAQFLGKGHGLAFDFGDGLGGQRIGRQHARGVARVDARFFDVLHNPGDVHVLTVGQRVHVHFNGVFKGICR